MSENTHKEHFRSWVDTQTKTNEERKKGRAAALSSVKEKLVDKTIRQIEQELKDKRVRPMRTTFGGFRLPWKKK